MTTVLRNTAEGYANGATVTAGTSGGASGVTLGITRSGTGALLQASTDHPNKGLVGYKYSAGAGETSLAEIILATPSLQSAAQLDGHYMTVLPTVAYGVMQARASAGGSVCTVNQRPDGKLEAFNQPNASVGVSTGALSVGIQYTLDARAEVGSATTTPFDGLLVIQAKRPDGTVDATLTISAVNLGTSTISAWRFMKVGSGGAITNAYADNLAVADAITTFIPQAANLAPTANAGADQTIDAGTTLTLVGSGTDADGTIASYAWTKVSGPTVTITNPGQATATVAAIPAGHYVFRLTVTDDLGTPGTDDISVWVQTATARPETEISNAGGYTNVGGAATRVAALADNVDTSYIETPDNPSGAVYEYLVEPLKDGQTTYTVRLAVSATTPTRTCVTELRSGTTVIASMTNATTDATNPLTTAFADYALTLSPTQLSTLAAITGGRNDLRLRHTWS